MLTSATVRMRASSSSAMFDAFLTTLRLFHSFDALPSGEPQFKRTKSFAGSVGTLNLVLCGDKIEVGADGSSANVGTSFTY